MTQAEMDTERTAKERAGTRHTDVTSPGGTTIRVFTDGTAYALAGFGGRYVKFPGTGVWDFDAPDAALQYSHADAKWASENETYTAAWNSLQGP
jgi:hypothetical protein